MKKPPSSVSGKTISFDDWVIKKLAQDANLASAYLKTAFEEAIDEEGRITLLNAIKQIAKAQGIGKVAKAAGIPRESLSRALSSRGNPRIDTLLSIVHAMGLELTVQPMHH